MPMSISCTSHDVMLIDEPSQRIGAHGRAIDHTPTDLQQLRVPPEPLHCIFAAVAVSAQYLDRPIGDVGGHGTSVKLHTVTVDAVAGAREVQVLGDGVNVGAARSQL